MIAVESPSPDTLVIRAGRAEQHYWRDLWRYRELLGFLAWRDIQVRYKQAVLGFAWAIIQPAVQTVLLTFVFGKLAKMPGGRPALPAAGPCRLAALAALLLRVQRRRQQPRGQRTSDLQSLFSAAHRPAFCARGCAGRHGDPSGAFSSRCLLLSAYCPTWRLLLLPVFIVAALLIALGAGLWITALTVKYRDFRFITPFLLQIGMFVTPVGYRTDFLPNWRDLLALNPLTGVVDGFRWSLLGANYSFYLPEFAASFAVAVILVVTGVWFFRRTENQFADVI